TSDAKSARSTANAAGLLRETTSTMSGFSFPRSVVFCPAGCRPDGQASDPSGLTAEPALERAFGKKMAPAAFAKSSRAVADRTGGTGRPRQVASKGDVLSNSDLHNSEAPSPRRVGEPGPRALDLCGPGAPRRPRSGGQAACL